MGNVKWQVDQEDPRPLYYQVKEMIRSGIMHGDWKPNELLPTEEAFCKRLGVSRITVARAIKELVNEGLIYRVQGKGTYVADPAEQSESSKTIGLVLHRTEVHSESYFYDTIQGIDDLARERGFRLLLLTFDDDTEEVRGGHFCFHEFVSKQLRGIIIAAEQIKKEEFQRLKEEKIPFVVINYTDEDAAKSITMDWHKGAKSAAKHLISCGFDQISYIGGMMDLFESDNKKYAGFTEALAEHGLQPYLIKLGLYTQRQQISEQIEEYFTEVSFPSAVFCGDDLIAAEVLQKAQIRKIRVPQDLAIVGFGNLPISTKTHPELTTINVPRYEMGRGAMELLLEDDPKLIKRRGQKVLPAELIIRGSSRQ